VKSGEALRFVSAEGGTMWWPWQIEKWARDYPVQLTLVSLAVGCVLSLYPSYKTGYRAGNEAGYKSGFDAGASKNLATFAKQLGTVAGQKVGEQQCVQAIQNAGATAAAQERQQCRGVNFLRWYGERLQRLAGSANKLLQHPNAAQQLLLNNKIDSVISQAEDAHLKFKDLADALDSEAARVREMALKSFDPREINTRLIALAESFAGKVARLQASLDSITPPPSP
jgi:hypothetical protein